MFRWDAQTPLPECTLWDLVQEAAVRKSEEVAGDNELVDKLIERARGLR